MNAGFERLNADAWCVITSRITWSRLGGWTTSEVFVICEKHDIIPIKLVLLWLGNYRVSAKFLPPDQLALYNSNG